MARLEVTVVCGECEHYKKDCERTECPKVSNVGLTEDKKRVIWNEDLDTIILSIEEITKLADMLGYQVIKKGEKNG
jgi:hypothetical protein